MKKILPFIIILLLIGLAWGFFYGKMMIFPQYSLKQLKKAVSENHITLFEKYIDLDLVVDNMVTQVWDYYSAQRQIETRWDRLRQKIGSRLLLTVKPNLKEIVKEEILDYVRTGQWAENKTEGDYEISSLIVNLIKERIDPQAWDYQSINYTRIKGDRADIGLTYYESSKETNFLVKVKVRDMKGYWQVIEITNIAQLLDLSKIEESK